MLVSAIIVTYNSNVGKLTEIVTSMVSGVSFIIVDNSTDTVIKKNISEFCEMFSVKYLSMNGNCGIASAQNLGIQKSLELGATDILFLDDDSVPDKFMLENLVLGRNACFSYLSLMPIVCANALNNGEKSLADFGDEISAGIYKCRELISSGTLINEKHISCIGVLEERLFIDCVDFEWGWRAQSLGFDIYLIENALLMHRLGEGTANFISIKYPSPIRHYYQYRNILLMLTRGYVPLSWKISQAIKLPTKFILIFLLLDNKIIRGKYAIKGVVDFFKRKFGSI